MAKDNFILHNASGKVGNLVTYKREGKQVTREWVAEVKNPKTYMQSQQRNFLAPVSKFFAPLAVALETSFEGLSKAKSHSKFQKENINLARREGFYMPKGLNFFPAPYKLSQGTLTPIRVFSNNPNDDDIAFGASFVQPFNLGTLSQMFINNYGAKAGDQVTIIAVADLTNSAGDVEITDDFLPTYRRFYLDPASADELGVENGIEINYVESGNFVQPTISYAQATEQLVAAAVILSRWENGKWRRSTQYLFCKPTILALIQGDDAKAAAIESYMEQSYTKQSDVYLNGSSGLTSDVDEIDVPYNTLTIGGSPLVIDSITHDNVDIDGSEHPFVVGVSGNTDHVFVGTDRNTGQRKAIYQSGNTYVSVVVEEATNNMLLVSRIKPSDDSDQLSTAAYRNYLALKKAIPFAASFFVSFLPRE